MPICQHVPVDCSIINVNRDNRISVLANFQINTDEIQMVLNTRYVGYAIFYDYEHKILVMYICQILAS